MRDAVACLGAGRMGRGIAVVFAYAGHEVALVDAKSRPEAAFERLAGEAWAEIRETLAILARIGLMREEDAERIAARIRIVPEAGADEAFAAADIVFEGVPEVASMKHGALARASAAMRPGAILASTTSTILVDDLSGAVRHPERFLNAHWLNPAYLVPLVELSPGRATDPAAVERTKALLEEIGKVPVVCRASPGFIVPRIQALAMNEAARLVEEGVASAADIDKAVTFGFGFRFAVLGLLEFIDWGGGDILFHASRYLAEALEDPRFSAPAIVERNMAEGRLGLRSREGFLDYEGVDIAAYREARLRGFAERLRQMGLARSPAP